MRPATSRRYRVSLFDGDVYDIIVEAPNSAEAIDKAKRIYGIDGLGHDEVDPGDCTTVKSVRKVSA